MIFDLFYILLILYLIFLQGFFANSEMSIISSNQIKMQFLANNGDFRAKIIVDFLKNPERLFGTTLVGVNLFTVISTTLAESYLDNLSHKIFIPISVSILQIAIMHPMIVIFGELFPMSSAREYPNTTALRNSLFLKFFYYILFPLVFVVSSISKLFTLIFKDSEKSYGVITRDELVLIFNGRFENANNITKKAVKDVLEIKDLTCESIMIHLNNVEAVSEDINVKELREKFLKTKYSRLPVYRDNIFNIVATVHQLSILDAPDDDPIKKYCEKLYIVPATKKVIEVLKELKTNRKYMGIVVDEFGAACGIVTIENIVEEIIGDIKDELDEDEDINNKEDENIFDGLTYLDDFEEKTGINFDNYDVDTIGGVITTKLGRIPVENEIVNIDNKVIFQIIEATDRIVKKVKILEIRKPSEIL